MANGRRFNLIRELGSGAFGTVYLAEMQSQGGFKKEVAIKLLNPELTSFSEASQRLRDEARLLGKLRHRHIVQVDDLVRLDGRWAVIMEHVEGSDLERILEALETTGERMPTLAAVELVGAVAQALDAAFNAIASGSTEPLQVVHRDIKPGNIRITKLGEVKVLDFGIARAEFEEREAKTGRIRYGSLGYMSPERLLGDPEIAAGDVFAVGCVLIELLNGRPLGRIELAPEAADQQVRAAVEEALGRGSGPAYERLCSLAERCLAYSADARPTAAEVADRCRELAREVEGEDLPRFSRRFMGQIATLIDDQTRPARGTLSEEVTGASAGGPLPEEKTNPTLVFGALDAAPLEEEASPVPAAAPPQPERFAEPVAEPESKVPLLAGLGVAALLLVGVSFWAMNRGPAQDPPVAPVAEEIKPPAVAEPVQEPETVEELPEPEVVEALVVAEVEPEVVAPPPKRQEPAPIKAAPEPEEAPVAAGPTLRSLKVKVEGASKTAVRCGAVAGSGSGSALLREVPSGICTVSATVDGAELSGRFTADAPRGYTCTPDGESLTCR